MEGWEECQGEGNMSHGSILQPVAREGEGGESVLSMEGLAEGEDVVRAKTEGGEVPRGGSTTALEEFEDDGVAG